MEIRTSCFPEKMMEYKKLNYTVKEEHRAYDIAEWIYGIFKNILFVKLLQLSAPVNLRNAFSRLVQFVFLIISSFVPLATTWPPFIT